MNVEFYDPEDEQALTVASAAWDGADVTITAADDGVRGRLAAAFRRSAVLAGAAVLQPGDLAWFRAAATLRAPAETGLAARLVPGVVVGGFDPAAGYRTFDDQVERLDARSRD